MRKNYYINWFPSRNSNYSLQFAYFSLDYIKEKKEVKVESKLQIISPLVNFIFLLKSFKKNFSSSLDFRYCFSDHFCPATAPSEHDTIIRRHEQGSPRGRSNQGIVVRSSSIRHRVEEPSGARNRRIGEELEQRGPMQGRQGRLLQALSSSRVCKRENEACTKLVRSLLDNVFNRLNVETNEDREEERVSLCQCALVALQQLNLASKLPVIQELLMREKAVTLSQVQTFIYLSPLKIYRNHHRFTLHWKSLTLQFFFSKFQKFKGSLNF